VLLKSEENIFFHITCPCNTRKNGFGRDKNSINDRPCKDCTVFSKEHLLKKILLSLHAKKKSWWQLRHEKLMDEKSFILAAKFSNGPPLKGKLFAHVAKCRVFFTETTKRIRSSLFSFFNMWLKPKKDTLPSSLVSKSFVGSSCLVTQWSRRC